MDDDFDIYEDLPLSCNVTNNVACSQNNEDLSKECEQLKKEVTELTLKLEDLQKINETLEVNLSSLLKTAKAEIARKDKMIDELRRQVDNMSFRRGRFNRNIRESNDIPAQQIPISNMQELNDVPSEDKNLTTEEMSIVNTNPNGNQFNQDQYVSDYESFNTKCYNAKYGSKNSAEFSKGSTTVFTERLRKRIIEEEKVDQEKKLEEKEKQNLLLENNHENNKEVNIDDKENQSQFSIWNSNVDNTNLRYKGTDHDYADMSNNAEENAPCIANQERLALGTKASGKRVDYEIDVPCNKRRKLEVEQNVYINKNSLSKKENVFNGYDHEIIPNTRMDKLDYEEGSNTHIDRNNPHYNAQYDRNTSRLRPNDSSYKRKEHYKKSSSDYNYSKESTHYHEKDKYSRARNRSPVLRHSDRKHKYHDRHRDHRDKFDKRSHVYGREEDISIISNKRLYDLRDKDKHRSDRKYNTAEFNLSRSRGSRYPDSRASRSVSHERSKSGSRERTNHKIYERRSSKSSRNSNGSEERVSLSLKKKDETGELKATTTLRRKDNVSEKLVKTNVSAPLKEGEIKSTINVENKKIENLSESINVCNYNQLENESMSSKPVDVHISNDDVSRKEKKSKNNDNVKRIKDTTVNAIKNVNTSPEMIDIPLVESKQDCTITTAIIAEEESKCDKRIVEHRTVDKEVVNTCNNIQNFPKDISNGIKEISTETRHKSNIASTNDTKTEEINVCDNPDIVRNNAISDEMHEKESNESKEKHSLSENNFKNQTPALDDLQKPPPTKSLQKNERDNNGNKHIKSNKSESKKDSSERANSRIIIVARRRKRVQLADNNASMTIIMNANSANSDTNMKNDIENNLKLRARKVSRSYKDVL